MIIVSRMSLVTPCPREFSLRPIYTAMEKVVFGLYIYIQLYIFHLVYKNTWSTQFITSLHLKKGSLKHINRACMADPLIWPTVGGLVDAICSDCVFGLRSWSPVVGSRGWTTLPYFSFFLPLGSLRIFSCPTLSHGLNW